MRMRMLLAWALVAGLPLSALAAEPAAPPAACAAIPLAGGDAAAVATPSAADDRDVGASPGGRRRLGLCGQWQPGGERPGQE